MSLRYKIEKGRKGGREGREKGGEGGGRRREGEEEENVIEALVWKRKGEEFHG